MVGYRPREGQGTARRRPWKGTHLDGGLVGERGRRRRRYTRRREIVVVRMYLNVRIGNVVRVGNVYKTNGGRRQPEMRGEADEVGAEVCVDRTD